jgi:hypothetical protein
MTPKILLEELQMFIAGKTKDMVLPAAVNKDSGEKKERPAEIHIGQLPDKDAEVSRVPYVLLQFIKSTDDQKPSEAPECECMVRIVAATYSLDGAEGSASLENLLTHIRLELIRAGIIGGQFLLRPPLETFIYPDCTPPIFLGEMMTRFKLPAMESEVERIWH